MKPGMSLLDLATTVQDQRERRRDFIAPVAHVEVRTNGQSEILIPDPANDMVPTPYALGSTARTQLGNYLGIPTRFYDALASDSSLRDPYFPDRPLFDTVVNGLLAAGPRQGDKRFVRTLSPGMAQLAGQGATTHVPLPVVRGWLSDRYRPIDNPEILERLLPVLANTPGVDLRNVDTNSMAVTDERLYLKITTNRVQQEVRKGDVIQAGVLITNSEVGLGSFAVQPYYVRLLCLNGATATDFVKRKFHSGARWAALADGNSETGVADWVANDTMQALNAATILEMRDLVQHALSESMLGEIANRLRDATERKITGDPVLVVQEVTSRYNGTQDEQAGILRHLIEGGDLSLYGLSNAVNRFAQDVDSYDRSTALEVAAGKLIALPAPDAKALLGRHN